jgi:protoporphyrinogen IX oxidase
MIDLFFYYKALHLIFMVSWFAGLFYTVRLFIYFSEADDTFKENASIIKRQYQLMQKRLWYIIACPAMLLTLIFGVLMLIDNPSFLSIPYMHVKLTLVFLLVVYHVLCHFLFLQQKRNINNFKSGTLRLWNEIATVFLVSIIFVIVLKNQLDWIYGTIGFFIFGLLLFGAVQLYKKLR